MTDGPPHESTGSDHDLFGQVTTHPSAKRQLPLPLAWSRGSRGDDPVFLTGRSNAEAVRHVLDFARWLSPASILVGPAQSGRSTLAAVFAAHSGGTVVDGLAGYDAETLFHQWNAAKAAAQPLLIIADTVADVRQIALPDLATRLATAPIVTIGDPDPDLMADVIVHALHQRGIAAAPELGAYVAARIDRTYAALHAAVAAIDAHLLAHRGGANSRNAGAALRAFGLYRDDADSDSPEVP